MAVAFLPVILGVTAAAASRMDACSSASPNPAGCQVNQYATTPCDARTCDPNGTTVAATFDLLNCLTGRTITPGSGVSNATTSETYKYDGASRVVYGQNNASLVT